MVDSSQETDGTAALSASRMARGTIWAAIDNWTQQGSQLVAFVVIGNIVGPETFGIMAMAMLFALFVHAFLVDGFSEAIVQRLQVDREHLEAAFWTLVLLGIVAASASLGLASWIAAFFAEPVLVEVIRWLSVTFVFVGASSLLQNKLRREFRFRAMAIRSVVAYGGGAAVGVALAAAGHGIWSLVAYQIVLRIADFVVLVMLSRWVPRPRFSWSHFRDLLHYGMNSIGTRIATIPGHQADRIFVGYFLGATTLGLYGLANRVVDGLSNALTGVMHTVALSIFAKLQDDKRQFEAALGSATHLASLVIFPAFAGLALVAPVLVDAALNEEWRPAATIVQILCVAGFTYPVSYFLVSALLALGKADQVFGIAVFTLVVRTGLCLLAIPYGVTAVAVAVVAFEFLTLPISWWLLDRQIGLRLADYAKSLMPATLGTLVMVLSVLSTHVAIGDRMTATATLVMLVATGGITYLAALAILARPSLLRVIRMIRA